MADDVDDTTAGRLERRLERTFERLEDKTSKLEDRLDALEKAAAGPSQAHETAREVVRLLVAILTAGGVSWWAASAPPSRTAELERPGLEVGRPSSTP